MQRASLGHGLPEQGPNSQPVAPIIGATQAHCGPLLKCLHVQHALFIQLSSQVFAEVGLGSIVELSVVSPFPQPYDCPSPNKSTQLSPSRQGLLEQQPNLQPIDPCAGSAQTHVGPSLYKSHLQHALL